MAGSSTALRISSCFVMLSKMRPPSLPVAPPLCRGSINNITHIVSIYMHVCLRSDTGFMIQGAFLLFYCLHPWEVIGTSRVCCVTEEGRDRGAHLVFFLSGKQRYMEGHQWSCWCACQEDTRTPKARSRKSGLKVMWRTFWVWVTWGYVYLGTGNEGQKRGWGQR